MSESFELDPVDWITAGALGEPGERTFYLQATQSEGLVALVVEKPQVQHLAQVAQELLARVDVVVTPDDLDTNEQQLREPVVPAWRAGSLAVGMDEDGERFLLEAHELTDDDDNDQGVARFWMGREHLVGMAAYAAFVVEAGARPTCELCDRPTETDGSHVCPVLNGHSPLFV